MALIHERIADARRIEASYPPLINSYVAEGTLLDMMNRPADADAAYRKGLQFDRRPEIYFNMAGTAMARGQREPAIELYLYAILFNPTMLDYIPYEDVKEIVRRRCRREGGPCP
jgi:Flp pilus assembly protein TadD